MSSQCCLMHFTFTPETCIWCICIAVITTANFAFFIFRVFTDFIQFWPWKSFCRHCVGGAPSSNVRHSMCIRVFYRRADSTTATGDGYFHTFCSTGTRLFNNIVITLHSEDEARGNSVIHCCRRNIAVSISVHFFVYLFVHKVIIKFNVLTGPYCVICEVMLCGFLGRLIRQSWPNKAGLKCLSVRPSIRPCVCTSVQEVYSISVKFCMYVEVNEWCTMVCSMTRSKVKVMSLSKLEIRPYSKAVCSAIYNGSWQLTTDS